MSHNFEKGSTIEHWGYSYGQRLYAFDGVNQVERVVELLSHNPFSKSATITLLHPNHDTLHTPCLTMVDFKIRNESLIIIATFRSQDIGKKMYADAIELLKLGTSMLHNLPAKEIILIHDISSAHIYYTDLPMVNNIINSA